MTRINRGLEKQRSVLYREIEECIKDGSLEHDDVKAVLEKIVEDRPGRVDYVATDWNPVEEYEIKLLKWNEWFKLGLHEDQIFEAVDGLTPHDGLHQPTGISLRFGQSPVHDWETMLLILKYELKAIGVVVNRYDQSENRRLTYYRNHLLPNTSHPEIKPVQLAIDRFWNPIDGGTPAAKVREEIGGDPLPSTEVGWLLALNPQMCAAMHQTIPGLIAAGASIGTNCVPVFGRGPNGIFVDNEIVAFTSRDSAVVTFR